MLTQELHRGGRVFYRLRFIESLIKLKRFLPFSFRFVSNIDAGLLPPKEIRADGDKPVRRIPITNITHDLIHAKNFLQDDDAWPETAGRQRQVGAEFSAIE
jgi:hypothetical protein